MNMSPMATQHSRHTRIPLAPTLLAALTLSGCVGVSEKEVELYRRWQEDTAAPNFELPNSSGLALGLCFLWPGAGHFYLGRNEDGLIWSTAGLALWPTGIPGAFAAVNSDRLNIKYVAKRYRDWLIAVATGPVASKGQQQQQQQVVVVTGGGATATRGAPATSGTAKDPGKERLSRLERLAELLREGVLTQAEFDREKARILAVD